MPATARERALELATIVEVVLATIPAEVTLVLPREAKLDGDAPSESDVRWLRRLIRSTERAERRFASALTRAFLELGPAVARVFVDGKEAGDALRVELALARAGIRDWPIRRLRAEYERHYELVGELTYDAVEDRLGVEIGWNLEDRVARAVVAYGGTRAGLLDVEADTRAAIYAALEDGRSEGEGPAKLARRIRQYVTAGRFVGLEREREGRGVAYRAEMIARTETTYARNVSAIAAGETAGFDRYLVFDARIGATDADCEALNGQVVDGAAAAELVGSEHPNGTRSISPVPRVGPGSRPERRAPARPVLPPARPPTTAVAPPTPAPAAPAPSPAAPSRTAPLGELARRRIDEYEAAHRSDPAESAFGVLQDGTRVIEKSGIVNRVYFTTDEVRTFRGAILTHNHPSGTAFSGDDYHMLRSGELYEIRASRNPTGARAPTTIPVGGTIAARLTAAGAATPPAVFRRQVEQIDDRVRQANMLLIDRGELSIDAANRRHWDEVADLLVADGMVTIRREP